MQLSNNNPHHDNFRTALNDVLSTRTKFIMKRHTRKTSSASTALGRTSIAASILCGFCGVTHAQSSVEVYGLLETGVRYSTNADADGNNKTSLADGFIHPSRLGFKGTEALGGNLKAVFVLEAGLILKNGQSFNGAIGYPNDDGSQSRLFGREAYAGLEGNFGSVKVGRQYTTAYVQTWDFDPIYGGGLVAYSPTIFYTGVRQDNVISYQKAAGPLIVRAHHAFGEQGSGAGKNFRQGSSDGLGLSYADDGLGLSAAYQQSDDNTPGASGKKKVGVLGGSYKVGAATLSLGYIKNSIKNNVAASEQKNDVLIAAATYATSTPWSYTTVLNYDKQRTPGGTHLFAVAMADYAFSRRTSTFAALDYHRYGDALLPYGPGAINQQAGVTAGIRHSF